MKKPARDEYRFDLEGFFPRSVFDRITEVRIFNPAVIMEEAQRRRRRRRMTKDGKLVILAADHPARMVTRAGDEPLAMGDRQQYLGRILRVLASPEIDGVMGTTDIIEDLFIVNWLVREAGGESFLDERIILGCMNRSGLAGAAWEMDDRMTSFTAASMAELRLDGAKMMVRVCLEEPELSNRSLEYCARAISECNARRLSSFLEPLAVKKREGGYFVLREMEALVKIVGVASALGDSSRNLWLKIPHCEDYETVARATTLPCLMLGGETRGEARPVLEQFDRGMRAGNSIRGVLVGRNVLFCGREDPLGVAQAVNGIVRGGMTAEQAESWIVSQRDKRLDLIATRCGG